MKERKKVHLDIGVSEDFMIALSVGHRVVEMTWVEALDMSRILDFLGIAAAMGVGATDETILAAREHATHAAFRVAELMDDRWREREQ